MKQCPQCRADMDDDEESCPVCDHTVVPQLDDSLLGFWQVKSVDRPEIKFKLFYLLPEDIVEFAADGFIVNWKDPTDPYRYFCRTLCESDPAAMNVWSYGFYHLKSHCVYRITGDSLEICVSANNGPRPNQFKRDDKSGCSLLILNRCEAPKIVPPAKKRLKFRKGSLIPTDFLKK